MTSFETPRFLLLPTAIREEVLEILREELPAAR
jgi:hypothetical protein